MRDISRLRNSGVPPEIAAGSHTPFPAAPVAKRPPLPPASVIKAAIHRVGRAYIRRITQSAKDSHKPKRTNERPIEYEFAMECLNAFQPRSVLDVGTGESELPAVVARCGVRVDAIDNVRDYWVSEMVNRSWPVEDIDITAAPEVFFQRRYDMVTCISVLEHITDASTAIRNMLAVLNPGGHLILTVPYSENSGHANVYKIEGSYGGRLKYKASQYTRRDLDLWFGTSDSEVVCQRYYRAFRSSYWSVGELVRPIESVGPDEPHQLTCLAVRKTGFGV